MAENAQDTLSEVFARDVWTVEDHGELIKVLFETPRAVSKFKERLGKLEAEHPDPRGAAALKVGMARAMLCRFSEALEALGHATDNKDRHVCQGLCHLALRDYEAAAEDFDRAKAHGADADPMDLKIAEAHALAGRPDEAAKTARRLANRMDGAALYHYVHGLVCELQGDGKEAVAAYERARTLDPTCGEATFRLAYYLDLHGDEDEAMALYQESIATPPVRVHALLNLAVLYDDAGRYDEAIQMARRVLAVNPTHPRARLILKDAQASKVMFYDEEQARRQAYRDAILDTPVTDFELSVRARNCLKKMNIRTLGDLVRTTEIALMSYKNFGETSLKEIKDMLTAKGLSLGQGGPETEVTLESLIGEVPAAAASDAVDTPIDQVELSIRVRRALEALNVSTLGDLASKTEAELLACPNFGQTSLNEVHAKLIEHGLSLAGKA